MLVRIKEKKKDPFEDGMGPLRTRQRDIDSDAGQVSYLSSDEVELLAFLR